MSYEIPPVSQSQRRGILDKQLLDLSSDFFKNKIVGIIIGLLGNVLFIINAFFRRSTIVSLCCLMFLYIIIVKLAINKLQKLNNQK